MGFLDLIRPKKKIAVNTSKWQELGAYQAIFSLFGNDIFKSETVRACIRPLSAHTGKATVHCSDERIEYLLNYRPNLYMNGTDFLRKVRNYYEITNTCFILIDRDRTGKAIGFYPIPYSSYEALEYNKGLFIKFFFLNGQIMTVAWEDLAVLRKDYNSSDIAGDTNDALNSELELISTSNQGIKNAIKATANLRGILKNTKGMLAPEKLTEQKDQFVKDYISLENKSGIASLDSTQEFTPINMNPSTVNAAQLKEFREEVQRYFGVNDAIIQNKMTAEEMDTFYEGQIAPFLEALSIELTSKVFLERQIIAGAFITYDTNKLEFISISKKIELFKAVVLYGGMTINEWRRISGMDPIEGGDELVRRLDAAVVDDTKTKEEEEE
ncbi:MAG: phage portal protein [Bacteroidales bacterium]|nr:phage portal protein [Candidatus Scybalousia scybalohippi]